MARATKTTTRAKAATAHTSPGRVRSGRSEPVAKNDAAAKAFARTHDPISAGDPEQIYAPYGITPKGYKNAAQILMFFKRLLTANFAPPVEGNYSLFVSSMKGIASDMMNEALIQTGWTGQKQRRR